MLVSTEHVVSKWYGDSEKRIAEIWNACDKIGGAVIFFDEVDALGNSRDKVYRCLLCFHIGAAVISSIYVTAKTCCFSQQPHEVSRRILSVLLQKIDGFEGSSKSTLICATNRMQDLDAALLSRFDLTIGYHLPGELPAAET